MAKSRGNRSASPRQPKEDVSLDDIELLNVHRYPDSMPPSAVAFVRNSKACQKRLEELLKAVPGKKSQQSSGWNQLIQQKLDETRSDDSDADNAPPPAGAPQPQSAGEDRGPLALLRKLFS